MSIVSKMLAEFVGTFWLVFAGCGSAVLSFVLMGGSPPVNSGIGLLGVALAFGLSVLTMAYAVGHVSGGHFNPAVSTGLLVGGRFSAAEWVPYVVAQVAGAIAGIAMVVSIAGGKPDFHIGLSPGENNLAINGYDKLSPGGYNMVACATAEFVLTFIFLIVILGATDSRAPAGFAPIPIGLVLTLLILVGGPVTNLSVNPARSTGPALFVGDEALKQLWLFWAAPMAGAIAAGVVYRVIAPDVKKS